LVKGKEERHAEGQYYIEWRDPKRKREKVGTDAAEADARRRRKEAELAAIDHGIAVVGKSAPDASSPRPLIAAIEEYLTDVKLKEQINKPENYGRHSTYGCYSTALCYFRESCTKTYLEDIDRRDLLKFAVFLQGEKEQGPRSVANKFDIVMSFLKAHGITGLIRKEDRPRYTEEEPEIYEPEELDAFFKACDEEEYVWFNFFLMTGEREQEVRFTFRSDVNLKARTVRVKHKLAPRKWSPKRYKEREIPIPDALVEILEGWMAKTDKRCPLLFPTSACKPKMDFWDCVKAVARRGGLDEDKYWLHKFRATFATNALAHGVDLRTVQLWLGHTEIESTMRYLKPSRSAETHRKVNEIFPSRKGLSG
jgi:integrase/recombinase XerD